MVKRKTWTEAEDTIIREMYGSQPLGEIVRRIYRELGTVRREPAIRNRAGQLGVKRGKADARKPYTP